MTKCSCCSSSSSSSSSSSASDAASSTAKSCLFTRFRNLGLRETPEATRHWWAQRISAFILAIMTPWFAIGVLAQIGQPLPSVQLWLSDPSVAVMMGVFIVVSLWHAAQGLRVVLDDYIHHVALRDASIRLVQFGCAVSAFIGLGALGMIFCTVRGYL